MPPENGAHEPGPAEFDRIVSRLRAENPQFVDAKSARRVGAHGGPKTGDGSLVTGCLAVIVTMSLIIGGWIGLLGFITSVLFVAQILLQSEAE
jgi:hypothetical protein